MPSGGYKMKKFFGGTLLLALMFSFPLPTKAEVSVNIGFSLPMPPAIGFHAPPRLVVLPNTDIYVDPEADVDIFFNDGWWWRPYRGEWYRSRDYNSGWTHNRRPPSFYNAVPRHWRDDYREHKWKGHQWNPERRDHREVQKNWNHWKEDKHREKNKNWGVQKARQNQYEGRQSPKEERRKNNKPDQHNRNDKHNKNKKHGNH